MTVRSGRIRWLALLAVAGCVAEPDEGTDAGAGSSGSVCGPAFGGLPIHVAAVTVGDYVGRALVVPGNLDRLPPAIELPSGERIGLEEGSIGHGLTPGEHVLVAARVETVNDGAMVEARLAVRDAETGALRFALYEDYLDASPGDRGGGDSWATTLPGPEVFGFALGFEAGDTCVEPADSCWTEGTVTQRLRTQFISADQAVSVDDGGTGHITIDGQPVEVRVATARDWPPDRSACTDGVESGAWLAFNVLPAN